MGFEPPVLASRPLGKAGIGISRADEHTGASERKGDDHLVGVDVFEFHPADRWEGKLHRAGLGEGKTQMTCVTGIRPFLLGRRDAERALGKQFTNSRG